MDRVMVGLLACLVVGCAGVAAATSPMLASAAAVKAVAISRPGEETSDRWFRAGSIAARQRGTGKPRARNIILFVGDGMSLTTVAAARIFEGQANGQPGEEHRLSFEEFPQTAFSRTYNTDSQTPDSAGTMTAMITGAKTRIGMLSVGQAVPRGDCDASRGQELVSALELAEVAGLSTGVVTNTRFTHATPAASYAHVADREWESDGTLSESARAGGCRDIARQFAEFDIGDGIDVAMGGGRSNFLPNELADVEYPDLHGNRRDGRNLVAEWNQRHPEGRYVWNAGQLAALDLSQTSRLLGLFEPDHMNYERDRGNDRGGEPSLSEMTGAAISVLKRNPKGFLLIVESGRIDHAHHAGNAWRALSETVSLSDAVRVATKATSVDDTLILVTADHSHTLSFVGYARRGNPILGKVVGGSSEDHGGDFAKDALGLPFTTLTYANGPGYSGATEQQPQGSKRFPAKVSKAQPSSGRPDLTQVDTTDPDYLQESTLPLGSETHGGDDVGIWARGPGSEAVRGSLEQNVIFHLMVQAQPRLIRLLCNLGDCEQGVPVRRPVLESLPRSRRQFQPR